MFSNYRGMAIVTQWVFFSVVLHIGRCQYQWHRCKLPVWLMCCDTVGKQPADDPIIFRATLLSFTREMKQTNSLWKHTFANGVAVAFSFADAQLEGCWLSMLNFLRNDHWFVFMLVVMWIITAFIRAACSFCLKCEINICSCRWRSSHLSVPTSNWILNQSHCPRWNYEWMQWKSRGDKWGVSHEKR